MRRGVGCVRVTASPKLQLFPPVGVVKCFFGFLYIEVDILDDLHYFRCDPFNIQLFVDSHCHAIKEINPISNRIVTIFETKFVKAWFPIFDVKNFQLPRN